MFDDIFQVKHENQASNHGSNEEITNDLSQKVQSSPNHRNFQNTSTFDAGFKSSSEVSKSPQPMYTFQGAQQYRHPDHVIRKSHKTERYSDTGKKLSKF